MSHDAREESASVLMPLAYAATGNGRRPWPLWAVAVLALGTPLAIAVLLPSLSRTRGHSPRVRCASNLRQIGQGVEMYANEHRWAFPPDFATLLLTEDLTSDVFICLATGDERAQGATTQAVAANLTAAAGHVSYVYTGQGLTLNSPPNAVVAYEPLSNHRDGMNVLFVDGHIQWLNPKQGARLVAELAAGHNPPRAAEAGKP
jgi:prepilin-type processing-associated H-X9-DG protein